MLVRFWGLLADLQFEVLQRGAGLGDGGGRAGEAAGMRKAADRALGPAGRLW